MKNRKILFLVTGVLVMAILATPVMAADGAAGMADTGAVDTGYASDPYIGAAVDRDIPDGTQTTPYPTDIQLLEQGARNYLYKTYTVAANYDPDLLVEPNFTQGGYRYRFSEIIQRDSTPASMSKTVTENKTVESSTNDQAEILSLFGSKLPYSDSEGYEGELIIIPESLTISETGRTSYSYTVTDTKRFDNLDSNDMSYIPKTTIKNSMTLNLQTVDWEVTGTENMGYSGVPSKYSAIATYSAPATGSKASGYTATAVFKGDVVKPMIGKNTYTIVYEGEQIVIPFNYVPLIIAGAIIAGCIVACVILWKMRKNCTIYTMRHGVPELYGKVRIKPRNPVLDLSRLPDMDIRLVFDKRFDKALFDKKVFVIGPQHNFQINMTGSLVHELITEPDEDQQGGGSAKQPANPTQ